MRDLLTDPAWTEEELGIPLPDSPHACSVSLPTWEAVVGYEEGRDKVTRRMRAGYPRFFRHPTVERLFSMAKSELALEDEDVILLPTRASVQRAQRWVERRAETAVRISSFSGLQALVVPAKAKQEANLYWRFSGEIISSRQAQDFLDGGLRDGSKSHLIARRLAKLAQTEPHNTYILSSGMAAVNAVLRSLPGLKEGKKTLQLEFPYVDCLKVQELFGNGVVYLNHATGESFDEALQRIRQGEFAGVFTEAPSNPLLETVDLEKVAAACAEGRTPFVIDDSAGGPANIHGLRFADVVTGSLTKWLSGMGDVMGGSALVREDSPHAAAFREALESEAADTAPLYIGDAEVLLSNLANYEERMKVINSNGVELATYLAEHPAVEKVWHPSLGDTSHYDAVKTKDGGYGGLLSFVLKNEKRAPKVFDTLKFCKGPGFGTVFTLICPYTLLAHYHELEWAEGCGVPAHLLRVSVGIEPFETIRASFEEALAHAV